MLHTALTTTLLTLSVFTTALPISFSFPLIARETALTEAQLIDIAPTSQSCDNPPAKGECATAKQAAKFTSQSFDTYQITSKAEQAAIISLMAFESDDFKYNKNHFPGVPGQGSKLLIQRTPFFFFSFLYLDVCPRSLAGGISFANNFFLCL